MKGGYYMSKGKRTHSYRENLIAQSKEARTVRKIVFIILLSLVLIFLVGGISGYMYIKSALEPVDPQSEEEIQVSIPMGSSTSTIASILEESNIIKDARIFRFYIKFKNKSDFQAGEYTFSQSLTLDEIIESLQSGKVIADPIHTVTIPEGKTIDQMAEIYSKKLSFTKDEFIERVEDKEYIEELIEKYPTILSEKILDSDIKTPLEGYLFAATYSFYEEDPPIETVIEDMLDKTAEVIQSYDVAIAEQDLTVHEVITMASLIENEARTEEQRKKIAGVFYNRLEEGMMLQTDPTVLYAHGEHKDRVLYEDLEIDSPYNTYIITDLPIGPISNFAENSLEAALFPEESEYMYFLHDFDGNIHYAKTLDEHTSLKEQYRSEEDYD